MLKSAAKGMGLRLKVERDAGLGAHEIHLRNILRDLVPIHLLPKVDDKAKTQNFTSGLLAA